MPGVPRPLSEPIQPKDWASESAPSVKRGSWTALGQRAAAVLLTAAALWIVLFAAHRSLPFVRSGASIVGESTRDFAERPLFTSPAATRVVAFGNSKVMAGFKPAAFDEAADPSVRSVNMAIPGESGFMSELEAALRAGNRPTHVLLQFSPLPTAADETWLTRLRDSHRIVRWLVPFRDLPRDLTLFAFDSLSRGGPLSLYRANATQVSQIAADRGWYFIKSQSRYPGDRLPDDYHLPTDTPAASYRPVFDTGSTSFGRLLRLAAEFDFQVVRIPVVYRIGEYAPPDGESLAAIGTSDDPNFRSIGPPYLLYPPALFSDPVHLNPAGAERYSRELARIFRDSLG